VEGTKYKEEDLQLYEEIHNSKSHMIVNTFLVLEVYNWLANKYEKEFIEKDLCQVLILRVCEIVDSILLTKDQRFLFLNSQQ
jgi:positive regulator of sigma E activity